MSPRIRLDGPTPQRPRGWWQWTREIVYLLLWAAVAVGAVISIARWARGGN